MRNLFEQALTHSSYVHEHGGEHNERLEFLGDAVLQLCVSRLLYDQLGAEREGTLSDVRQRLVGRALLARLARELGLDQALREEGAPEIRRTDKPLSDVWEALLGAVYLEVGLDAAMEVVRATVLPHVDAAPGARHPKTRLQEWCQAHHGGAVPSYATIGTSGPDHQRRFRVEVRLDRALLGEGEGSSLKAAQLEAAADALVRLGLEPR